MVASWIDRLLRKTSGSNYFIVAIMVLYIYHMDRSLCRELLQACSNLDLHCRKVRRYNLFFYVSCTKYSKAEYRNCI